MGSALCLHPYYGGNPKQNPNPRAVTLTPTPTCSVCDDVHLHHHVRLGDGSVRPHLQSSAYGIFPSFQPLRQRYVSVACVKRDGEHACSVAPETRDLTRNAVLEDWLPFILLPPVQLISATLKAPEPDTKPCHRNHDSPWPRYAALLSSPKLSRCRRCGGTYLIKRRMLMPMNLALKIENSNPPHQRQNTSFIGGAAVSSTWGGADR